MKIKKYLIILLIILVFATIINNVSAFTIDKYEPIMYVNGSSEIPVSIEPDIGISFTKAKKELNSINKIVVKVNGKTVNTIKKGKSWNKYKTYPYCLIDRSTKVKGNIKGKKVGICVYNAKNKLLKSKIFTVKTDYISKIKINKKKAIEITKNNGQVGEYKIKNAVLKKSKYDIPYYWKITFVNGVSPLYIDAVTGRAFNPIVHTL